MSPLKVGDRVTHYGRRWTGRAFATIKQVVPQNDGSFEYQVLVDEDCDGWPRSEDGLTWWPSYYTRLGENW